MKPIDVFTLSIIIGVLFFMTLSNEARIEHMESKLNLLTHTKDISIR